MKTKFFRKNAPVIPTGAKRSGGISRLTHNATIKAGAHVSRFLGKLGMTMVLLWPAVLAAQNGVTVSGLNVNAGTVTLDVHWEPLAPPTVWSDTVWVFVDYNAGGVMKRLELSAGATLTATSAPGVGKVEQLAGNNTGVRVIGNARSVGSFSAMCELYYDSQTAVTGACAYASNYPPEAEYINIETIKFTGTPPYDLVLQLADASTVTRQSGDLFNPVGRMLLSFTDKTGAPGIMKCIPPATYTLSVSASSFCAGSEGVVFTLSGTESGRDYQLYRDNSAVDNAVLSGTGSTETFTGTFDKAGTYSARTIADELYCAIAMSGSHAVIENPLPTEPDVNKGSRECPGTVTISASSSDAVIDWYADLVTTSKLKTGASYTTPEIETSTTYYVQARVENTGCLSARVPVLAEVIITATCCDAPGATGVTFADFNPCSGASYNSTYTLTDARDQKPYKVKYMADKRYWMVQNLRFGTCSSTSFYNDYTAAATTRTPTVFPNYVGHCRTNARSDAGFLYTWPAAMQNSNAYNGGNASSIHCTGTASGDDRPNPGACQGICPAGWHVPTIAEFERLYSSLIVASSCTYSACFTPSSAFEGEAGSVVTETGTDFALPPEQRLWSSTQSTAYAVYYLFWRTDFESTSIHTNVNKNYGLTVRCVRNYY